MKDQDDDNDESQSHDVSHHAKKIALTSLSAAVAETATFPIDLIKTRLQLHGESLSYARPASTARVVSDILRNDGVSGLYKGLSPAIVRHLFYTPIRIVGYEYLRNAFAPSDHSLSLSSKALIGGISGVIAQVYTYVFIYTRARVFIC